MGFDARHTQVTARGGEVVAANLARVHWLLAAFKITDLLHPEFYIRAGGWLLVCAVIFAESGLLVGFFLPGDSLLFTAGFLTSPAGKATLASWGLTSGVLPDVQWLIPALAVCAIAGDQVGYMFGKKVGPALFNRPDSRLFKQDYVRKAEAFFDHYGAKAIVLARFVPIVRTFTPIIAGVSKMHYRTFVVYNVVGGLLWTVGVTLLGYFLGQIPVVQENLEIAILAVVFISLLPMIIEGIKHWRAAKRGDAVEADATTPVRPD